jgi:hypothetical protein
MSEEGNMKAKTNLRRWRLKLLAEYGYRPGMRLTPGQVAEVNRILSRTELVSPSKETA